MVTAGDRAVAETEAHHFGRGPRGRSARARASNSAWRRGVRLAVRYRCRRDAHVHASDHCWCTWRSGGREVAVYHAEVLQAQSRPHHDVVDRAISARLHFETGAAADAVAVARARRRLMCRPMITVNQLLTASAGTRNPGTAISPHPLIKLVPSAARRFSAHRISHPSSTPWYGSRPPRP